MLRPRWRTKSTLRSESPANISRKSLWGMLASSSPKSLRTELCCSSVRSRHLKAGRVSRRARQVSSIWSWIRSIRGRWTEVILSRYPSKKWGIRVAWLRGSRKQWTMLQPYQPNKLPNCHEKLPARKSRPSPSPRTSKSTTLTKKVRVEAVELALNFRTWT